MPRLERLSPDRLNALLVHPVQVEAFSVIERLIGQLRSCGSAVEFYEFQQDLLSQLLDAQTRWAACARVQKRLRNARSIPADAPEIRSPSDLPALERYTLEADAWERFERQLRSVGDALAWRAFDFQRDFIVTLSRNDAPGPMAKKEGLAAERAYIERARRDDGHFALLHDLTNCLRIGDTSVFVPGGVQLHEIKTDPTRRQSAQLRRVAAAIASLSNGTPMPGGGQYPVQLAIPYITHLKTLREVANLAAERGVQGAKVQGGRALTVAYLPRAHALWTEVEFELHFERERRAAMRRAGLRDPNYVTFGSLDRAARAPADPPWAIYPLRPTVCAGFITDRFVFVSSIGGSSVVAALTSAGLTATWHHQHVPGEAPDQSLPILDVHNGRRTVSMNYMEFNRLLLELVDLDVWAEQIRVILDDEDLQGIPWPHFDNERAVWA